MRFFRFLFPFAFRKYDLAKYTALFLWVCLSMMCALFLGILFLELGSFWQYISIPFWLLFLYDLAAAVFSTLHFFGIVSVRERVKLPKSIKATTLEENDPADTSDTLTQEAVENP